jgi:drug/metabolite transporter (DMT)-like permease
MLNLTDLTGLYFVLMLLFLIAGIVLSVCRRRAEKRGRTQTVPRLRSIGRICLIAAGACLALYLFSFVGAMSEYAAKGH